MSGWVKLPCDESAAFAALSLRARGLHATLWRRQRDGVLDAAAHDVAGLAREIARRLGATAGDRRWIADELASLLSAGYLARRGESWVLVASDERPEPNANVTRTEHERDANRTRTEHEPNTKSDASVRDDSKHAPRARLRSEEIRGDQSPSPNPLPQAEGGSEVSQTSKRKSDERPAPTATCTTREHLGTDPHEVALTLGASVPRLRHFPGGLRDDFRRAAAPLRIEWSVLAAWFGAGGTRRHRSERVTWSWLLGHGGGPLAECWALAQEWDSKGRPALDDRGEIATPKAPQDAPKAALRVVPQPLAWLKDAPPRITPAEIALAKAGAKAKVAGGC